jgi:hypothetical protein
MPVVCYFALLFRHNRGASRVLGAVYVFLQKSVLTVCASLTIARIQPRRASRENNKTFDTKTIRLLTRKQ